MLYTSKIEDMYALEAVSLEANFLSNAASAVIQFFPSMLKAISSGFSQIASLTPFKFASSDASSFLSPLELNIQKALQETSYLELTKFKVAVPEGLNRDYLGYAKDLTSVFDYHEKIAYPAIVDYYTQIAAIITNKDSALSVKDNTSQYTSLKKARDALNDTLSSPFQTKSNSQVLAYEKAFKDNNEVIELFKVRHQLLKALQGVDIGNVQRLSTQISDSLKVLIDSVRNGTITTLSSAQLKNLTAGAYEIAQQLEFFAVNYHRVQILAQSVALMQESLKTRLDIK